MSEATENNLESMGKSVDATGCELEYHPSIRALVKILARKAAEERYDELLSVMREKYGDDVDKD
jgi:hypothetical protein